MYTEGKTERFLYSVHTYMRLYADRWLLREKPISSASAESHHLKPSCAIEAVILPNAEIIRCLPQNWCVCVCVLVSEIILVAKVGSSKVMGSDKAPHNHGHVGKAKHKTLKWWFRQCEFFVISGSLDYKNTAGSPLRRLWVVDAGRVGLSGDAELARFGWPGRVAGFSDARFLNSRPFRCSVCDVCMDLPLCLWRCVYNTWGVVHVCRLYVRTLAPHDKTQGTDTFSWAFFSVSLVRRSLFHSLFAVPSLEGPPLPSASTVFYFWPCCRKHIFCVCIVHRLAL